MLKCPNCGNNVFSKITTTQTDGSATCDICGHSDDERHFLLETYTMDYCLKRELEMRGQNSITKEEWLEKAERAKQARKEKTGD